jgi:hypothetical protein
LGKRSGQAQMANRWVATRPIRIRQELLPVNAIDDVLTESLHDCLAVVGSLV